MAQVRWKGVAELLSDWLPRRGLQRRFDNVCNKVSQAKVWILSVVSLLMRANYFTEPTTTLPLVRCFKLQVPIFKECLLIAEDVRFSITELPRKITSRKAVYLIPKFSETQRGHCYSLKRRQDIAALLDEKKGSCWLKMTPIEIFYERLTLLPHHGTLLKRALGYYMEVFRSIVARGFVTGLCGFLCWEIFRLLVPRIKQAIDLHT